MILIIINNYFKVKWKKKWKKSSKIILQFFFSQPANNLITAKPQKNCIITIMIMAHKKNIIL